MRICFKIDKRVVLSIPSANLQPKWFAIHERTASAEPIANLVPEGAASKLVADCRA